MIGDSNNDTNFSQKLFLTDTEVLRFPKALVINSSVNIKIAKPQLSIRWYR